MSRVYHSLLLEIRSSPASRRPLSWLSSSLAELLSSLLGSTLSSRNVRVPGASALEPFLSSTYTQFLINWSQFAAFNASQLYVYEYHIYISSSGLPRIKAEERSVRRENPWDGSASGATGGRVVGDPRVWVLARKGKRWGLERRPDLPDRPQQRAQHGGRHVVRRARRNAATLLTLPNADTRGRGGAGPQGAGRRAGL